MYTHMNARYAWTVLEFFYSYKIYGSLTLTCDLFDRNVSIMEDLILVVLSTLPLVMVETEKV